MKELSLNSSTDSLKTFINIQYRNLLRIYYKHQNFHKHSTQILSIKNMEEETLRSLKNENREALERLSISVSSLQQQEEEEEDEDEDDDEKSMYYKIIDLANDASIQCLLSKYDDEKITSILPWCHVNVEKSKVVIEIDYRGIFYDCEHFATAIGFPFDGSLLVIEAFFDDFELVSLDCLRRSLVSLSRSKNDSCVLTSKEYDDKMLRIMDRVKRQQYGVRVLVPHLIREYCDQKRDANYGNMFVELLNFIGCGLRSYKNVCVRCKKELPPFSRFFYCDAVLCLYSFEDNGMGFSILQELQNTKLVEFEITTAKEASKISNFNYFDPFPTFLLNSTDSACLSGCKSSNLKSKNEQLLSDIIRSFPSAAELKICNNEAELIFKLHKAWLESSSSSIGSSDASSDINAIWLPYDLLRFILFTNRFILWPLPEYLLLNVPTSMHQFGVIYDSETEKKFGRLRQEHGSVFSFCWSATYNWYSLLRCSSKGRYMSDRMENQRSICFFSKLPNSLMMQSGMIIEDTDGWEVLASKLPNSIMEHSGMRIEDKDGCEIVAVCEIFSASWSTNMEEGMHISPLGDEPYAIRYLILFYPDRYDYDTVRIEGSSYHNVSFEPVNLLEYYALTRDTYEQENISQGITERGKYVDLFKGRKLNRENI